MLWRVLPICGRQAGLEFLRDNFRPCLNNMKFSTAGFFHAVSLYIEKKQGLLRYYRYVWPLFSCVCSWIEDYSTSQQQWRSCSANSFIFRRAAYFGRFSSAALLRAVAGWSCRESKTESPFSASSSSSYYSLSYLMFRTRRRLELFHFGILGQKKKKEEEEVTLFFTSFISSTKV